MTLRVVFRLPLRQTEGFLDSLLSLMGLDLEAPDHTTLSRRNQTVEVPPLTRVHDGPIYLVVSSALCAWFLWSSIQVIREKTDDAARRMFRVSLGYLAGVFLALLIDLLI